MVNKATARLIGVAVFFTFHFALCTASYAFNAHQPFDISADLIDYVDVNQTLTAEGHVTVVQDSSTLTADWMTYDRAENRLQARGHVVMHDKGEIMVGDSLDYDLTAEVGNLTNAMGVSGTLRFKSKNWDRHEDYYSGRDVAFTSCDLIDPHYHLRSSRLHLIPNRLFWAWNTRVYVDGKPVFYTPFVYKYLDKRRVAFQAQFGNDTVNGAFVKTTTSLYFNDDFSDQILVDHYSVAGNGVGNQFNYISTGTMRGSLFGYYIDPHTDPNLSGAPNTPQYTIRSYHWQKVTPATTLQSNVNLRKNISFNDQFFPEDTNQAVSDITNSIALTQQRKNYNQRLVVETLDAPDPGDTSTFALTHVQSASLPRYDFTLYQVPLWSPGGTSTTTALLPTLHHLGPLQLNMNSSLGEVYSRLDEETRTKALLNFTLSDGITLSRRWSFTPSLTPQVNWQDKADPANQYLYGAVPPNSIVPPFSVAGSTTVTTSTSTVVPIGLFRGFQGRLGTTDTLRYRATRSLTLDQIYTLTLRMEPNGTGLDRSLSDGGVESNHLTWLTYWRPSYQVLLRSFSGVDMRKIEGETPDEYDQRRVDPWTSELTLMPRGLPVDYFFRYQFDWYPTRTGLWEGMVNYHGPFNTIVQTGLLFNSGQPGVLTWNNSVGVYMSPGWRVDAMVHSFVPDGSGSAIPSSIIDSQIVVTRDLHCATAQFIYRNIPPYTQSYSLLFNFKVGPSQEPPAAQRDIESSFYPWRANVYAR